MPEKVRPEKVRPDEASSDASDAIVTTGDAGTEKHGDTAATPHAAARTAKAPASKTPASKTPASKAKNTGKLSGATAVTTGDDASSEPPAPAKAAPKKVRRSDIGDRSWVPWVFVPVGLIGVAWLVVYYIVGDFFPGIAGGWNILVGMGCMAAAFAIATLWK